MPKKSEKLGCKIMTPKMLRSFLLGAVSLILLGLSVRTLNAATSVALGDQGVTSLQRDGVEFVKPGGCIIKAINLPGGQGRGSAQISGNSITRAAPWGSVTCNYSVAGDRVNVDVTITNRTPNPIDRLSLQLLTLDVPMPRGRDAYLTNTK